MLAGCFYPSLSINLAGSPKSSDSVRSFARSGAKRLNPATGLGILYKECFMYESKMTKTKKRLRISKAVG